MYKKFVLACLVFSSLNVMAQQDMSLIPYREGDKWGFVSESKQVTLSPKYSDAGWFAYGYAPVKVGNKWGYIDRSGKMVIPAKFTTAKPFRKGYVPNATTGGDSVLFAAATLGNNTAEICINVKGQTMKGCPAIPENSVPENTIPVATVTTQKTYSLPNNNGLFDKVIDDYKITGSDETYYLAMKDNKYGVFNSKFETIVPFEYNEIRIMRDDKNPYLQVGRNNMYGIYGMDGQSIISPEYTTVNTVTADGNSTYYIVKKDGKAYVKDSRNQDVVDGGYADVIWDKNGFIIVDDNQMRGYYTLDKKMIKPRYKEVQMVNGKYLLVKTSAGKSGYINIDGEEYFID